MRRYVFYWNDGKVSEFKAEMDTLREGVVILSKKKQYTSEIVRTDVQPEIVAVVSLANLKYYEYA